MTTIGNLVSKEKEIIKKIANNYESNLPSEFYVARRNLLVACSTLAFLMVTSLENGKPFIKFNFFVNTEISIETLIFMLALTCSYFYFRFRALAKVGLFRTHEKSQIDYVLQVSLDKFNQELQRKIDALYGTSRGSYPWFQFNSCSDTGEYRTKATPQTYFTVHYRLDSKHWGKWTKEEIEDTLNILGMTPKYHSFSNGASAITVDQTTQLNDVDLSHYKRIERYIRYATNSLFMETLLPMCFYWLMLFSAASLAIYRGMSQYL
ncbi:hypothetical protein ACN08P_06670 [Photobacterium leiognathi subsp. mandapamensis]|uniref:hypothetical protein n=1 Tax=Photobacterium leiognathi TaxID=553611 RepID=UPI0027334B60|nr:hypothetical protein [Photobacterium leiognathi]